MKCTANIYIFQKFITYYKINLRVLVYVSCELEATDLQQININMVLFEKYLNK